MSSSNTLATQMMWACEVGFSTGNLELAQFVKIMWQFSRAKGGGLNDRGSSSDVLERVDKISKKASCWLLTNYAFAFNGRLVDCAVDYIINSRR